MHATARITLTLILNILKITAIFVGVRILYSKMNSPIKALWSPVVLVLDL